MNGTADLLTTLGVVLLLGLLVGALGKWVRIPRVTLLLVAGFALGPAGLDLLSGFGEASSTVAANMALVMVAFLLGEKFTLRALREDGRLVLWFSLAQVVGTAVFVAAGLIVFGVPPPVAILLAGIAPATDPAATADVVRESRARGPFSRILLGIVAVDDAWGVMVFSLAISAALVLTGGQDMTGQLLEGVRDIGGAMLLGVALGVPSAYLTGRIAAGEPTLVEALGVVLLCGGLAIRFEVSFILAAMVLGTVVANLARHHDRPFHAIEGIEWPFLVVFFVFAGASLHPDSIPKMGLLGAGYCFFRAAGRIAGAWAGGYFSGADPVIRRWMGFALMPQAGVALGLAMVAADRFPALADNILTVAVGATVFFELTGPLLSRLALKAAGEASPAGKGAELKS